MTNIVTVDFRGDTLIGFNEGDKTYIAVRPIADAIGISWGSQYNRIKRDPILSEAVFTMKTPAVAGGTQEALCLPLDLVNGWLFTIQTDRIKDEDARQKVIMYQRECYRVLADHFQGHGQTSTVSPYSEDATESESVKLRMVTEGRQTFGTQAAAQLWMHLGLPVVPAMVERSPQLTLFDFERVKHVETQP